MIPSLSIPDSVSAHRYWASCRAVLLLVTSLGVQSTALGMIAIGPLAESPYDPRTLTRVGRSMLTVEFDPEVYAVGCLATVLLSCGGIWAWNRILRRADSDQRETIAGQGLRAMLAIAAASSLGFGAVLAWVGPGFADTRIVAASDLQLLAIPTILAFVFAIFAGWFVSADTGGESA